MISMMHNEEQHRDIYKNHPCPVVSRAHAQAHFVNQCRWKQSSSVGPITLHFFVNHQKEEVSVERVGFATNIKELLENI